MCTELEEWSPPLLFGLEAANINAFSKVQYDTPPFQTMKINSHEQYQSVDTSPWKWHRLFTYLYRNAYQIPKDHPLSFLAKQLSLFLITAIGLWNNGTDNVLNPTILFLFHFGNKSSLRRRTLNKQCLPLVIILVIAWIWKQQPLHKSTIRLYMML